MGDCKSSWSSFTFWVVMDLETSFATGEDVGLLEEVDWLEDAWLA